MNENAHRKLKTEVQSASFLPDLCGVRSLITVLIIGQLLAFILVLASISGQSGQTLWLKLGLVSLFVHWVALSSLAVLCLARKKLSRLSAVQAGLLSYLVILMVSFALSYLVAASGSELAYSLVHLTGFYFALKNTLIAAIVSAIALRFIYLHHIQRQISSARSSARVQALQARIRPHFLFNSMNTIAALIRKDPKHAEEAVEDLAELFRSSMMEEGRLVTLEDELKSVKNYLHIEALRLGERLSVEWQMQDIPLNAYLPPLILQPLFENAVYYGIEPAAEGGCIRVQLKRVDEFVELIIENPNNEAVAAKKGKGHQIALDNIRERLKYFFGKKGHLYLFEQDDLIRVILSFPLSSEDNIEQRK